MLAALLLACCFATPLQAGGPWTSAKGSGIVLAYAQLPAYRYSRLLTGVSISETQDVNRLGFNSDYGIYAEYGLADKLELLAVLPFKYVATGDLTDTLAYPNLLPEGSLAGFSNTVLGVKYKVLDKRWQGAVSIRTALNTTSNDLEKGLATGFDAHAFGLMGHFGGGLNDNWYGFAEAGYFALTNNFSHAVEGKVEFGRTMSKRLTLILSTDFRFSMNNGTYADARLVQTGFYPQNQEWAATSLKALYETDSRWGFMAGTPLIPIYFRYVGFNGTLSFGAFKKFGA